MVKTLSQMTGDKLIQEYIKPGIQFAFAEIVEAALKDGRLEEKIKAGVGAIAMNLASSLSALCTIRVEGDKFILEFKNLHENRPEQR